MGLLSGNTSGSSMKKRGSSVSLVTYVTTTTTAANTASSSLSSEASSPLSSHDDGWQTSATVAAEPAGQHPQSEQHPQHHFYDSDDILDEEAGASTSSLSSTSTSSSKSTLDIATAESASLPLIPIHLPPSSSLPIPENEGHNVTFSPHQRRRTVLSSHSPYHSFASLTHLEEYTKQQQQPPQSQPHAPQAPKRKDSERHSCSFHEQQHTITFAPEGTSTSSNRFSSAFSRLRSSVSSVDLKGHAQATSDTRESPTSAIVSGSVLPITAISSTATSPPPSTSKAVAATTATTVPTSSALVQTKAFQLVVGACGIYASYLYYGLVQEDLFRYHNAVTGQGFTHVWALQVLESTVTMVIGYFGRKLCGGRDNLPLAPFFKSGASQLAAKALMSMSLSAGLSFPVVTLAKSAKIVPVMLGQLIMGGSSYGVRDYMFAILIVVGTALLSAGGKTTNDAPAGAENNTFAGLVLISMSLTADGFTGGLQKKLKHVTASMAPTTYDFLYYSHMAQLLVATAICVVTGELLAAPLYLLQNPAVWWFVLASCICSAVGQCFIFYVISCFDPLVCTTITTTRKVLTVLLSITFKGHDLTEYGCLGLALACTALLVEVEGQVSAFRKRKQKSLKPTSTAPATAAVSKTTSSSSSNSGNSNGSASCTVPLLSSSSSSVPMGNDGNIECKMTQ